MPAEQVLAGRAGSNRGIVHAMVLGFGEMEPASSGTVDASSRLGSTAVVTEAQGDPFSATVGHYHLSRHHCEKEMQRCIRKLQILTRRS